MDHKREADRKSDATEPSPPPHDPIEPDPMNRSRPPLMPSRKRRSAQIWIGASTKIDRGYGQELFEQLVADVRGRNAWALDSESCSTC
jgi:hypothetical protein